MELTILPGYHVEMVKAGGFLDDPLVENKYISSVENMVKDRLYLEMPTVKGRYAPIHKDEKYDIYVFVQEKIFKTTVLIEGAKKEGNRITLITRMLIELKKYDRRAFFRISLQMSLMYLILDDKMVTLFRQYLKEGKDIPADGYHTGECIDLSAGGMKFLSTKKLKEKSIMCMRFVLDQGKETEMVYTILAHVIDSKPHPNRPEVFIQRVAFEVQNPRTREKIVSYIFRQQREVLQRK